MNYEEWLASVPKEITEDVLWHTKVYRQALFLGDLAWYDVRKLAKDPTMISLSDQLYRAMGSISVNISEGYSRASGKEQARFYEYALGSAREARDWYFKARHTLGQAVTDHRLKLSAQIIRQLLKIVPKYRKKRIQEERAVYEIDPLSSLLQHVPMPDV